MSQRNGESSKAATALKAQTDGASPNYELPWQAPIVL